MVQHVATHDDVKWLSARDFAHVALRAADAVGDGPHGAMAVVVGRKSPVADGPGQAQAPAGDGSVANVAQGGGGDVGGHYVDVTCGGVGQQRHRQRLSQATGASAPYGQRPGMLSTLVVKDHRKTGGAGPHRAITGSCAEHDVVAVNTAPLIAPKGLLRNHETSPQPG